MARCYSDPIGSVLTKRARRDLETLAEIASEGDRGVSPQQYLKEFIDVEFPRWARARMGSRN